MIKIFAKRNTTKKALVICRQEQVGHILSRLNEKHGDEWVPVDDISPNGEILLFDDNLVYKGFHGKDERYCMGIEKLI